ncbi:exodeoxyribonuclease-3 [Desulfuromusa kysingii]|uniref:Exodeoxyribonuclease-3 n=1 Tax=Desulfuromusa kysingii TaxID=37625 RepID=A0A1H3VGJ0_9BACT|nr:exodeoxyribonuclease III [Desulfuromusa kysingii]SDZ73781.1 exodeoxyribonuclease-3 [Desulfuromusa kysingii]
MKIVSFNVNGLRARIHQLQALVEQHNPDIIALQEIKVHDSEFPHADLADLGYHMIHHGQKGHYGVATFSRVAPVEVHKGYPGEDPDHQRRLLITGYPLADGKLLRVVNGYFPQGESRDHPIKFPNKKDFYANLQLWLEQEATPTEHLIVLGDMNIAPEDSDVGIGPNNEKRWLRTGKCCFLPEERQWLDKIKGWGLVDTYRLANPEVDDQFSWFDYRSRGFDQDPKRGLRIDLILATQALNQVCTGTGIDYQLRAMEKPSDHCPIWAEFALS